GQAVGVIARRDIAAAEDPEAARAALADDYAAEHLSASIAAREGFIDEVIDPHETRDLLAWALTALDRERRPPVGGNIPLSDPPRAALRGARRQLHRRRS